MDNVSSFFSHTFQHVSFLARVSHFWCASFSVSFFLFFHLHLLSIPTTYLSSIHRIQYNYYSYAAISLPALRCIFIQLTVIFKSILINHLKIADFLTIILRGPHFGAIFKCKTIIPTDGGCIFSRYLPGKNRINIDK